MKGKYSTSIALAGLMSVGSIARANEGILETLRKYEEKDTKYDEICAVEKRADIEESPIKTTITKKENGSLEGKIGLDISKKPKRFWQKKGFWYTMGGVALAGIVYGLSNGGGSSDNNYQEPETPDKKDEGGSDDKKDSGGSDSGDSGGNDSGGF